MVLSKFAKIYLWMIDCHLSNIMSQLKKSTSIRTCREKKNGDQDLAKFGYKPNMKYKSTFYIYGYTLKTN